MNPRTTKALEAIGNALKAEKHEDAVRLLIDALQHHLPPNQPNLAGWLARELGTRPAARLFKSLAHYPCFYCQGGLTKCEACNNHSANACNHCLDIKKTRCDFCDGAGWVTYNVVPKTLWLPMIVERTTVAAAQLKQLLETPHPAVTPKNAQAILTATEKEILLLNRLAGIFENALTTAQKLKPAGDKQRKQVATIIKRSRKAWSLIEPRMRQTLKHRIAAMEIETAAAKPAAARRLRAAIQACATIAKDRDFYQSSLSHPFLSGGR